MERGIDFDEEETARIKGFRERGTRRVNFSERGEADTIREKRDEQRQRLTWHKWGRCGILSPPDIWQRGGSCSLHVRSASGGPILPPFGRIKRRSRKGDLCSGESQGSAGPVGQRRGK